MADNTIVIGDVTVTALWEQPAGADVSSLTDAFPTVPADKWSPYRDRYPRAFAGAEWAADMIPCLVRAPGRTILVDTGVGPAGNAARVPSQLLDALRAHGLNVADVDAVFLTHLDGDHVGWNLTPAGQPTFPRARYLVSEREWAFAQEPAGQQRYGALFDQAVRPLAAAGVLDRLANGATLGEGVTTAPTPGHTPGHTSLLIASGGRRALILGDAAHHPAQLTEWEWSSTWDADPAAASATRERIVAWAERDDLLLLAYHFPRPGFGRVTRVAGRPAWQPVDVSEQV